MDTIIKTEHKFIQPQGPQTDLSKQVDMLENKLDNLKRMFKRQSDAEELRQQLGFIRSHVIKISDLIESKLRRT